MATAHTRPQRGSGGLLIATAVMLGLIALVVVNFSSSNSIHWSTPTVETSAPQPSPTPVHR